MTLRITFSLVRPALCAVCILLLAGCASVGSETARSSQNHAALLQSHGASENGSARPSQISTSTALPLIEVSASPPVANTVDLINECDDLLQRMRNGFSMPDINSDLVLYHQQWYQNRPDYLRRMMERSRLYLHHIVEELDKRGMPMELALLPMVESAYNPMAYSRAKASGLWQFIPATGKRYNLDQDWWMDERRDIIASTAAALDYLQTIYDMHGDWHLALASYNWGEGAVGRAVSKNRAQELPTDYLSLNMPRETKNYVPKLQALKNILSSPSLVSELELPRIPNRPYFSTVTRDTHIDIKLAARLAEMPVQDFVALNPSHNRPVIKADTPMVIPTEKYDTFISNLEAREDSNKPLSSWQSYTVRPGDKLEKIAPRFGMTVANLKAVNGIKGRIRMSPGLTLLVAGSEGGHSIDMAALPEQPRLPDANPASPAGAGKTARSHTVRKSETLPMIAKRYGMTVAEMKRSNNLQSNAIKAGTQLKVSEAKTYLARNNAAPVKTATTAAKEKPGQKPAKVARYTVRRGDTLYSIARQFKVEIKDLMRWNNVSSNDLKPGNTLTIQLSENS